MIPIILRLGPITIYSYGLMMALGFIAGDLLLSHECRRRGFKSELGTAIVVWGAVGGLAGARIYDVFDNWSTYIAHPASIIFSGAGFIWYGGLIGGIIATWLVVRYYRVSFLTAADMCAAPLVLGMAFGRMGCLLSGDGDWGLPSKMPWAMAYPHAIVGWGPETVLKLDSHDNLVSGYYPGVRVHPTPIYEAILYVAIFCFLWSIRKKVSLEGELLYLYLILGGAARFMVEFVRINPRVLAGLSEAQIISLIMIVAGSMAWYWSAARRRTIGGAREALRA
jgi:phosphatidylglycerol---prolipoprotein diacylglyceryl transferase